MDKGNTMKTLTLEEATTLIDRMAKNMEMMSTLLQCHNEMIRHHEREIQELKGKILSFESREINRLVGLIPTQGGIQ